MCLLCNEVNLIGLITQFNPLMLHMIVLYTITGGQKKRVTIGEFLCTNARLLCLDEITTGLDSSTAYDIIAALKQWSRLLNTIIVTALLQPTPAIYELFDNLILMREGTIVYSGPRKDVLGWLAEQGIDCPHDQDEADFLVEFLSFPDAVWKRNREKAMKRAEQSRSGQLSRRLQVSDMVRQHSMINSRSYNPLTRQVTAESILSYDDLARQTSDPITPLGHVIFHSQDGHETEIQIGATIPNLENHLAAQEYDRSRPYDPSAVPLTTLALQQKFKESTYWNDIQHQLKSSEHLKGVPQGNFADADKSGSSSYTHAQFRRKYVRSIWTHTKLNLWRQWTLLKRDPTFYGPRLFQAIFMGLVLGSLFWNLPLSDFYDRIGLLVFAPMFLAYGSMAEVPLSASAKLVVYKQSNADFYPITSYVLSVLLVYAPFQFLNTCIFGTAVYWMANFVHDADHYFFFIFALYCFNVCWAQFLRMTAYSFSSSDVAQGQLSWTKYL